MGENFISNRNLLHRKGNRRPRVCAEGIDEVREMFPDDLRPSIRMACTVLNKTTTTVHRILGKYLHLFQYRLQNLHFMRQPNTEYRFRFSLYFHQHLGSYSELLSGIALIGECLFLLNGQVIIKKPENSGRGQSAVLSGTEYL